MADIPPKDLCDAITEGRALIVCGAGVSRAATDGQAPGWEQFIRDALAEAAKLGGGMAQPWATACEALLISDAIADWLTAANMIQEKLGGAAGGPYRAFFVGKFGTLKAMDPEILQSIEKIAAARNRIATTNYDHLISQALGWDRADWTDYLRVIEALRGTRPAVWHIHGDFDRPDSIIFSQNDYDRIAASELPQFVQKSAGLNFTLVFVGCSGSGLSDDNVGRLLDWMRKSFAGLDDKHFALVADNETDGWPDGVTAVRFGGHADLPSYIANLAPILSSGLPPDPKMIGRKDRLEQLVAAILDQDRPIVVPGALGMGKTTLALAAAHDARVIERFGKGRRFFVILEPVQDSDGLLRRLAADLGLAASGAASEVETKIAAACASTPTLAILDNLETAWRGDSEATEALLGRLATIEGLRLVITVRGDTPQVRGPGALTLQDVAQLGEDDARALFLRHAGGQFAADPALPGLLSALDGHPLSIELLAANGAGKADLRGLAADWKRRRAEMLRRYGAADNRLTSLRVSLDISLAALNPPSAAHRLVRLMALLPDGMSEADSCTILSDGEATREERSAAARLENARLASRLDGRWRLLAPIRETLLADLPPEAADRARLMNLFLVRAVNGGKVGTDKWGEVRDEVTAEAGNLDAAAKLAVSEPKAAAGLETALWGLAQFHQLTGLASTAALPAAAKQFRDTGDVFREAHCVRSLGDIAFARSDHEEARCRYVAALLLYQQVGDVLREAHCVRSLGDIAFARSDHEGALERYQAALPLHRQVGDVLGEVNCVKGFGDIALGRSDHEEASRRYEAALPLYRRVGSVLGEASCIFGLGDIARARSDHEGARQRYDAALPLYRRVGSVLGEASCIFGLGDIARARSDYEGARQRFEDALPLFKQIGGVPGEANCIRGLGDIALARSDHKEAGRRYAAALPLYQKVGAVGGEANCAKGLGDIAFARSDHEGALERYQAALPLFKQVGNVLGEANCVRRLGDIALARSDHEGARQRYETALPFYRKVGDVLGEASCVKGFGDIAFARSDHEEARRRYEAALPLYRRVGSVLGEANCVRRLGDIDEAEGNIALACEHWGQGLALYAKIPEPYSIGFTHICLARRAAAPDEAAAHREAARKAWESIDRPDLIERHLRRSE